jgi:hypothetical protein
MLFAGYFLILLAALFCRGSRRMRQALSGRIPLAGRRTDKGFAGLAPPATGPP